MNFPKDLLYSKSHEWVREDENAALIGLTDYAQHELGDIVFVNLPEVGDAASKGERIAEVESVKAVSEVFSPLSGTVLEVNGALADSPETVNSDPYGAWLFKLGNVSDRENLMDAGDYAKLCGKLG
jgi:glycine cleavage system H protein